jgi:DNA-binding NtrC family response regulator
MNSDDRERMLELRMEGARPPRLLVVDDEVGLRFGLVRFLRNAGYEVEEAGGVAEGLSRARLSNPDLALLDFDLPDGNALDLMAHLRQARAELPVIILTAFGSIELAVKALQEGANQFITKPVELSGLQLLVERTLAGARQHKVLASQSRCRSVFDPFVGSSRLMAELRDQAERAATVAAPLLLLGETGSGKGVLARWIHDHGPRRDEAFVDLNCAGLSREFLESELFGHEKGAFTGATHVKPGLFELADRGSVFLDEIGDMDPAVQPAVLKAVEERRFRRLGGTHERISEMRLIAASHPDLESRFRDGRFRADLYFRISSLVLRLPPLRERAEDIPALVRAMLPRIAADMGRPRCALDPGALRRLQAHPWPGNLRELRNVLERSVLMAAGDSIGAAELGLTGEAACAEFQEEGADLSLEAMERRHVQRVLDAVEGDVTRAAHKLGIGRTTLYQKLRLWNATRKDPG